MGDPSGRRGSLSEREAGRLHALAERAARRLRLPEHAVLTRTRQGSKAGQVVGVLAIPGRTVEILPKIEGENGAVRLILLYPWTRGLPPEGRAREWTVAGTGIPLEIATIDVGRPDTAADALRRLIGPARNTAPTTDRAAA